MTRKGSVMSRESTTSIKSFHKLKIETQCSRIDVDLITDNAQTMLNS